MHFNCHMSFTYFWIIIIIIIVIVMWVAVRFISLVLETLTICHNKKVRKAILAQVQQRQVSSMHDKWAEQSVAGSH